VTLRPVRLATDEDLHEFVLQILRLADNPKRRRDLLAGRLRFTLAAAGRTSTAAGRTSAAAGRTQAPARGAGQAAFTDAPAGFPPVPAGLTHASGGFGPASAGLPGSGPGSLIPGDRGGATGPADHRIEKGAVTERVVQAAARAGARLVLGPRAVLTPLARDRARTLGVPIEKER